jgi:WD40 repeat protein
VHAQLEPIQPATHRSPTQRRPAQQLPGSLQATPAPRHLLPPSWVAPLELGVPSDEQPIWTQAKTASTITKARRGRSGAFEEAMNRNERAGFLLLASIIGAPACSDGAFGLPGGPTVFASPTLTGDPADRPSGADRVTVPCGFLGVGWQASKVAFSPDGSLLGVADGRRVKIIRVSDWTPVKALPPGADTTLDFAFTAGGTIAVATTDLDPPNPELILPVARIYKIDDGSIVGDFSTDSKKPVPVAFAASRDGSVLATLEREFSTSALIVTIRAMPSMAVTTTVSAGTLVLDGGQGPGDIAVSPDGTILAVSFPKEVRLYDTSSGTQMKALSGVAAPLSFSPNGKYLGTGFGIVDVTTGAPLFLVGLPNPATTLQSTGTPIMFSADSKTAFLASLESGKPALFSVALEPGGPTPTFAKGTTPEPASTEEGYVGIRALAVSPDGNLLVTAGRDAELEAWQATDGARVHAMSGHVNWVESMAVSGDGKTLVTTANRPDAITWNLESGTQIRTFPFAAEFTALSNDGAHLMRYGIDGADITVLHAADGTTEQTFNSGNAEVVALSADGSLVASGHSDGGIRLLRVSDGSLVRTLHDFQTTPNSLSFSRDGTKLEAGWLQGATVWNVADGAVVRSANVHEQSQMAVTGTALSPDGSAVALAGGGAGAGFAGTAAVLLLRVSDGAIAWSKTAAWTDDFASPSFSPDGRLLATSAESDGVTIWRVDDGAPLFEIETDRFGIFVSNTEFASGEFDGTVARWCVPSAP